MKEKVLYFLLKFIFPAAALGYLLHPLFFGSIMNDETFAVYSFCKFFFNNLLLGVYSSWCPYVDWGLPTAINLRHIGEVNPFLYLMPLFNGVGLDFLHAFRWTLFIYGLLAMGGFYLLAVTIFKDKTAAFWAYLLFFFSSIHILFFSQMILLLTFAPVIWFFYFLLKFFESGRKSFFLGTVFTLMLIAVTYIPLYFSSLFLLFLIIGVIVYGRQAGEISRRVAQFGRKNWVCLVLSGLALALACLPIINTYLSAQSHSVVAPTRHGGADSLYSEGVAMSFREITDGGLSSRMAAGDLYSHLKHVKFPNDGFFYVPMLAYIVLILSLANPLNRRTVMLGGLTVLLLLLCLSSVTPVHYFLYEHVAYFRLFRNVHYFVPLLLGAFVLFCGEQFRLLLATRLPDSLSRWRMVVFVWSVHVGIFLFLKTQEDIVYSSYVTLGLSAAFFSFYFGRAARLPPLLFWTGMTLVTLVQPVEVLGNYGRYAQNFQSKFMAESFKIPMVTPAFSFTRPDFNEDEIPRDPRTKPHDYEHLSWLRMEDSPGFVVPYSYGYPTYWSYYLYRNMPTYILRGHTRFKFYVYDQVARVTDDAPTPQRQDMLLHQANMAFVYEDPAQRRDVLPSGSVNHGIPSPRVRVIAADENDFRVKRSNANLLEVMTNFSEPKFLVYTDSYAPAWKAFINGKEIPLYRANFAFKGILIPAGYQEVAFRYVPFTGGTLYLVNLCVFVLALGALVYQWVKDSRPDHAPQSG